MEPNIFSVVILAFSLNIYFSHCIDILSNSIIDFKPNLLNCTIRLQIVDISNPSYLLNICRRNCIVSETAGSEHNLRNSFLPVSLSGQEYYTCINDMLLLANIICGNFESPHKKKYFKSLIFKSLKLFSLENFISARDNWSSSPATGFSPNKVAVIIESLGSTLQFKNLA